MTQELTPPASAQAREAAARLMKAAEGNDFLTAVLAMLPFEALATAALTVEQEAETLDAWWAHGRLHVFQNGHHLGGDLQLDGRSVCELWKVRLPGGAREATFREFPDALRAAAGLDD